MIGNSLQTYRLLLLSLSSGKRTHTHQLRVEAASAATRANSGLLIGRATTKLSLCARGASTSLQPEASMWPSPTLRCRRWTSLANVSTMWRSLMEKPCYPWVGSHDSALFLCFFSLFLEQFLNCVPPVLQVNSADSFLRPASPFRVTRLSSAS